MNEKYIDKTKNSKWQISNQQKTKVGFPLSKVRFPLKNIHGKPVHAGKICVSTEKKNLVAEELKKVEINSTF